MMFGHSLANLNNNFYKSSALVNIRRLSLQLVVYNLDLEKVGPFNSDITIALPP